MSHPAKPGGRSRSAIGLWSALKRSMGQLRVWFQVRPPVLRFTLLTLIVLVPAAGLVSIRLLHRRAVLEAQVERMAGDGVWSLDDRLPVVLGPGSILNFLGTNPVERINVIYKPLM